MPDGSIQPQILVVDDNQAAGRLLCAVLNKFGFEARWAPSGEAALAAVREQRFLMILLDSQMPGMDGPATARALIADGCTSPIIALTADGKETNRQRCLAAGMVDYLVKPVGAGAILDCLAKWLPVDA